MFQELSLEIEKTARAVVDEIHTALPGKIVSYNADKNKATIEPCGKYITADGKSLDYPRITEVPLVFPFSQKAGVGIAFPVKKGDSCLIIVSEVELDKWRNGAESEGSLRFDLTSAVAIPGLLQNGGSLLKKATSKDAVVIGASETEIVISKDGVDIASEGSVVVRGDFKVEGDISYTGSLENPSGGSVGNVSLKATDDGNGNVTLSIE